MGFGTPMTSKPGERPDAMAAARATICRINMLSNRGLPGETSRAPPMDPRSDRQAPKLACVLPISAGGKST